MDDTISVRDMLQDLRQTFNKRLPGGLTDTADTRLHRTLQHYVAEVGRVGKGGKQDILRMTYDSMAKWFRRNLGGAPPAEERFTSEMDPAAVFASIQASHNTPAPAPTPVADLLSIDVSQRKNPVGIQQKDILQPHEDTVKYREVEYNLIMNSKDRNWLQNTDQNRYNFSIQFNTNYRTIGFGLQGNIHNRLRNIVRLEFIKAILPVEGLSVVVPKDCTGSTPTNQPQNAFYSALALPYINILADEVQGNNYGTNGEIDKSLAVCQYDATWRSEIVHNKPDVNRGYTLFFPKFMKAQRVYSPTPLANLQMLSFRLQDPEGNLLSSAPDSSDLATIAFSNRLSGTSCYLDSDGEYIFLRTTDWFPLWSFSQLDKILLQGLTALPVDGSAALNEWLQNPAGHSVIGVAYSDDLFANIFTVYDKFNTAGYANWIIIRNRFQDPSTGSVSLDYFSSAANDNALGIAVLAASQTGGILNMSRQVQLSIRIITREYDLVANVRADNV